jgi:hypothetical protein
MSCEEAWRPVKKAGSESANAHKAYLELIGPPKFMKVLPVTSAESQAIDEARAICEQADEALSEAIRIAIKAQHPPSN